MKTVLTIAGFDPSSGAGVTADLMVFAAHGLFGTACITALTVQSTRGVQSTHPVEAQIVAETLACLDEDIRPAGVKIGMVGSDSTIHRICDYIEKLNHLHAVMRTSPHIPVVLDPVLKSTSGRELLDPSGLTALREGLLPKVDWLTPNLGELALLSGEPVRSRGDIQNTSHNLQDTVRTASNGRLLGIFAKGGHLDQPDDYLLLPDGEGVWLPGQRVDTQATHGTGCAFSSAFLSRLVLGDTPHQAAITAKEYVSGALRTAVKIGTGYGPMNHLWRIDKPID